MPFVRIDAMGMGRDRLEAVSDALQEAMVDTLGIPAEDRFHVVRSHDGESGFLRHGTYLDVDRDDGIVFVEITMRAGRTPEMKAQLYAKAAELIGRTGVEPRNLFIVLRENASPDWSLGNGEAHYLP